MAYENIEVETEGHVAIIRLNRPKALNALCAALVSELGLRISPVVQLEAGLLIPEASLAWLYDFAIDDRVRHKIVDVDSYEALDRVDQ